MTPHDRQHLRNLQALAARIRHTFDTATAASIAAVAAIDFDPQHPFSFDDHPHAKPTYAKAEQQLHATILHHITTAASIAWMLSQRKNNTLVRQVFSQRKATIPTRYLNNEEMDIRAFAAQRVAGLNLSQRVWNIAHQFRTEIEDSIDLALRDGIAQGRTAAQISREVRKYLNDPNARFRRIRDQHGILRLSQRAKAYHPGRGVYRSAYKNALRMTLTETNRTYRRADHDRWQTLDFVVGIHVQLSHLHTLHGHTFHDICDELAGRYPKDFLFLGWHPLCRCIATPILKTPQEMQADDERTLQGQAPASQSVNSVKDAPQLTHWQAANAQRIQAAQQRGTLPYFIKDNPRYFASPSNPKFGRGAKKEAHALLQNHKPRHNYTTAQEANHRDIEHHTGWKRGRPMNFQEADNGAANTTKDRENCAACVLVHELRLRGFDITAKTYDYSEGSFSTLLSVDTRTPWLTAKGKMPDFTAIIYGKEKEIIAQLHKQTQAIGSRYHLGWDKSRGEGHIVTVERIKEGKDGLLIYDPQKNEMLSLQAIVSDMKKGSKIELLCVDKLQIEKLLLNQLTEAIYR